MFLHHTALHQQQNFEPSSLGSARFFATTSCHPGSTTQYVKTHVPGNLQVYQAGQPSAPPNQARSHSINQQRLTTVCVRSCVSTGNLGLTSVTKVGEKENFFPTPNSLQIVCYSQAPNSKLTLADTLPCLSVLHLCFSALLQHQHTPHIYFIFCSLRHPLYIPHILLIKGLF